MKLWIWVACSLCGAFLAAGCVSKARHEEEVKKAFLAGQSEATMRMQKNLGQSITIQGQVRQSFIPWTREMTLAKAILAAGYVGAQDPREITIIRDGEELSIDVGRLLAGEDYPVVPGDTVRIK
jgi:hypothetical protein